METIKYVSAVSVLVGAAVAGGLTYTLLADLAVRMFMVPVMKLLFRDLDHEGH